MGQGYSSLEHYTRGLGDGGWGGEMTAYSGEFGAGFPVAWSIVVAVYAGSGGWGGEMTSYSGGLGAGFPAL